MRKTIATLLLIASSLMAHAQQRPAITGIAFVRLYASDVGDATFFYGTTLGFDHKNEGPLQRYTVSDSQWVEVMPSPTGATSYLSAVAFTTRDLAALKRYLAAHNVAIDESTRNNILGVHDPEGNLIYFVQPGAFRDQRPRSSPNATSHRIIHAGFLVRDRAAQDRFYRDILGFRPYWFGGHLDTVADWVSLQVPDGTDWIEYMLNASPTPTQRQLGVLNHFSLGVAHMPDAVQALARNHCDNANCTKSQMGRDGKVQLNLFDHDQTRVEFMEFEPSGPICCSPFTGKSPSEHEDH